MYKPMMITVQEMVQCILRHPHIDVDNEMCKGKFGIYKVTDFNGNVVELTPVGEVSMHTPSFTVLRQDQEVYCHQGGHTYHMEARNAS
jgi:hypothetical protein